MVPPLRDYGVPTPGFNTRLATACGFRGSMAQYLHATVMHLEALGIHDRHLGRMHIERVRPVGSNANQPGCHGAERSGTLVGG
jgi:hypothetical protein